MKALRIPADETQPMEVFDYVDREPGGLMVVNTFNHATAEVIYEVIAGGFNGRATRLWRHLSATRRRPGMLSGNFTVAGMTPTGDFADLPEDIIEYALNDLRPL